MAIYFGGSKLKCGYYGTEPLDSAMFGTEKVCTAKILPPPPISMPPQSNNTYKFIIYLRAPNGISQGVNHATLVGHNSTGYNRYWNFAHHHGEWFVLRATVPINRFYFNHNSDFTDAFVYRLSLIHI